MTIIKIPKKLIEVALPLDAINTAAAREKSIRHGHPSTLHLWWARRPSAAARAVIFAQMVNDPGYERHLGRGINKEKAAIERERLFKIIEKLVQWDNTNNEEVWREAQKEIWNSWQETCALNKNHPRASELFNPEKLPSFYDPFAGGGTLPLEAQRLGLESYASDLNPVAVTINKAMIEIPPKFSNRKPIGPFNSEKKQTNFFDPWSGAKGLAEDVRRYGLWMHNEAEKLIGNLYPTIKITKELVEEQPHLSSFIGEKLTVLAWLWAHTVKSPSPAYSHVDVPLASTFILSETTKTKAYIEPLIESDTYSFIVKMGTPPSKTKTGTKIGRGGHFQCLLSSSPISVQYIRSEGKAGRLGRRLMAIVAVGSMGRVYLSPTNEQTEIANKAIPAWKPDLDINHNPRDIRTQLYGIYKYGDLFTPRQLVALNTFSDLIGKVISLARTDAIHAGMSDDDLGLDAGGIGAFAYAEAIGVYLSFAISKCTDYWNTSTTWMPRGTIGHLFSKHAIPISWDYPEANPFAAFHCAWYEAVGWVAKAIEMLPGKGHGYSHQIGAGEQQLGKNKVISTDPPYYDNIGYADLSDFFYVWLRRSLKPIYQNLYATLAVPKAEELVATPYRHGNKEKAENFFLEGMTQAMESLASQAHPAFPVTIYYAFKQSETKNEEGTSSTGWVTFLEAVLKAGFALTGTWPMRTERANRSVGLGTNALASSIILVCRKRALDADTISRREFLRELNASLPIALDEMTRGNINSPVTPVDLSQAIIGPGMAIFSQYTAVLEADGKTMSVRTALQLINRFLAEDDFDHDTQFCLHWFETHGWIEGKFGEADVLARAKGTSVNGLQNAGVVKSAGGDLCLLRWHEYSPDWSPETDKRTPIWEALHQLIRALNQNGEFAAGALLAKMPTRAEPIRALAYRLYTLCERKRWAEDARAYNEIIDAWAGIEKASHEVGHSGSQTKLDIGF